MNLKIKDVNVHYITCGNPRGQNIVMLHGWGQNIEMMQPLSNPFMKKFQVTIVDLPGFGESEVPTYVWTLYDYVEMLHILLEHLKIKNPIIIGHSFGGKIGLLYASKYEVLKLVCLASPFKKAIEKMSLKTKILKAAKKLPGMEHVAEYAKKHIGSEDYRNASPRMREIMTEHVNLDITEEVKKISCPTLIIWGTNDEAVPVEDAYVLEKLINNAGVVIYEGCSHYAYLERLGQTVQVLNSFFLS